MTTSKTLDVHRPAVCAAHLYEDGIEVPAVCVDPALGPVCEGCAREIAQDRAAGRSYGIGYDYACGYHD